MIPPALMLPLVDLVLDKITNPGKDRETARTIAAEILADEHQVKPIYQAIDQATQQMNQNQISINRIESASDHFWKSGWRPAAGWICISALAWHYLIEPVLASCLTMFGMTLPPLPRADFNDLWTLLLALLGMSGLRSIDKTRQNNTSQHRPNTGPTQDN